VYKTFREGNPKDSDDGLDIAALRNFRPQGLGALVTAAGMSKAALPLTPARSEVGFMSSSLNTYGRRQAKKSPNAMKWIQGVKIGHRGADAFDSLHRKPSALAGDTPESLSDEMTFVAKRYKNVIFENADVHGRLATVTLNGPWGQNDKPVFLRINFWFPPSYPMEAMPEITFERTTSMVSDDVMRKLNVEIFSIIEHYKDRRRGCLEAVITYLLGERGLEESMTLTAQGGPYTSPADESSSDEEDGVGGRQDLETSGAGLAAQTNAPLPRTCGAIWARHGQLLCFCPPKPGATPLFSLDALRNADRGRKLHRQFEGFGWLREDSTGPKDRYSGSDDDHENSSSGSWTLSSSSSSSDGSQDISRLPSRFHPPTAWRAAMLRNAQKPSSHSSGGAKKILSPKAKSVVSIHDLTDLLPAKKVLAQEYQIFGDGPSLCEHNAEVAERLGLYTIAGVWELCKQILYDEVPLEIMDQHRRKDPILVLAKRNIVKIVRKDSGLDLGFDEPEAVAKPKLTARVKWGKHPLASSWLIPTLFVLETTRKVLLLTE
jgi:hypothetical protein